MIELLRGDCLQLMDEIPDSSIDLIACDLPYGTTACKWDVIIPFEPLWAHYKRLLKPRGAVVLTASQPFTSMLVMSNPKWFRHSWVWSKGTVSNFQLAKSAPLKEHEDVLVFSRNAPTYNPRMVEKAKALDKANWKSLERAAPGKLMRIRSGDRSASRRILTHSYPRSILHFNAVAAECNGAHRLHSSQKPVALMEYLIDTYSNDWDTVLDNACGSATTLIACLNTNRHGIGIEKDPKIHATAERRIAEELARYPLLTG